MSFKAQFFKFTNWAKNKGGNSGKTFTSLGEQYGEGVFGLVVALITFGLEQLLNKDIFKCPKTGYEAYGIAFFTVPAVAFLFLNLLTVPAVGNVRIWTLCERCMVPAYRRYGDLFSGFLSAFCVGLVAPIVWIFLALFDGQHLVCWELGYQLGDNITNGYLRSRGLKHLNVSDFERMVDDAKAKSQYSGAIVLGLAVFFLGSVIILKRSCLKPYDPKQRFPGLCEFEKQEALAASRELRRLLKEDEDEDEFCSDLVYCHRRLALDERIADLEERKKAASQKKEEPDESLPTTERREEFEEEEEEYKKLEMMLNDWAAYKNLLRKSKDSERTIKPDDDKITDAKQKYEKAMKDEESRIAEEREKLEQLVRDGCKDNLGEEARKETLENIVKKSRRLERLLEQREAFAFDKILKRWHLDVTTADKKGKEKKKFGRFLLSHVDNSFEDTPDMRGKIAAAYLIQLFKEKKKHFRCSREILQKFESMYPRAATSKPNQKYVNTEDVMYQHIFDEYSKLRDVSEAGVLPTECIVKGVKWNEAMEDEWLKEVKAERKGRSFWSMFSFKEVYSRNPGTYSRFREDEERVGGEEVV